MAEIVDATDMQSPIQADLIAVNQLILDEIDSRIPLVKTIAAHLINSGGKRLRPSLVLLAARCLDYSGDSEHHELATIIEFIHSATLLHDDVIDHSTKRRGQASANAIWDNTAAVLVGDFLYSRAFQILARRNNIPVMRVLANATNRLSEAEILQLTLANDPDIAIDDYYSVIDGKTAQLFAAATHIGAIIATDDKQTQQALRQFGWHLGMAFQIVDDLLDYSAAQQKLGKSLGDDLAEGKTTLPIIMALQSASDAEQALLRKAIKTADKTKLDEVLELLVQTKALAKSAEIAHEFSEKARNSLKSIPSSPAKTALIELTQFVVEREF